MNGKIFSELYLVLAGCQHTERNGLQNVCCPHYYLAHVLVTR